MSLRFHEIAEASHRILNPLHEDKLRLLAEAAGFARGASFLDLACGKGEMLCQWALQHEIVGRGVDLSPVFLRAAAERSRELGVDGRLQFIESEAGLYASECDEQFDVVSCIGATWIGGGLVGTLEKMKPRLAGDNALMLVGEPFWLEPPPEEALVPLSGSPEMFGSLELTLDRMKSVGFELVEMVMSNRDDWDRYEAAQWRCVGDWLREHPEDADAPALARWIEENQRRYLRWGRRYLGWGIFVLRRADG